MVDCTYCFQFRLYLLFSIQIAPAVYNSNCTDRLQFRLHLLVTVPIAPAVYNSNCTAVCSSDCICYCCTQFTSSKSEKSNAKRLIFRGGLPDSKRK
ncbi:hypothetical protein MsAc7_00900 [Methanolapillus millepedarum]|uniref:Uncharacterized protein n=1 Tax=Methanolapillus millepedarum TaxID=3028296 RepID=A0AA96V263_9EURY|nr:hypothetical protein MsAc7_00900 [Methanosarcinaceae archaeon Ac7]